MKNLARQTAGWLAAAVTVSVMGWDGGLAAAETNAVPQNQDMVRLIRANLEGVTETELNQAMVSGLLKEFYPRVLLAGKESGTTAPSEAALVARTNLYEGKFAHVRIGVVAKGLDEELGKALKVLGGDAVKGLILDLRGTGGGDYEAATRAVDRFAAIEQPLLDWGNGVVKSTTKTNLALLPAVVLVNRETTGAAEALAAMFREIRVGVVIGAATAGQASNYKDFDLPNGERLRIATSKINLGDGQPLTAMGVTPDVKVKVSAADERAYLADPYKVIASLPSGSRTNALAGLLARRALNEAELVRLQREGVDPDDIDEEDLASAPATPGKPVLRDPVLGRAIDLLKGLGMIQKNKPAQ
ncbi:MAG TPA: S41 family peptidase [Verrucomicrobiae bacterium]|nr:S41 family peptidase [Verrucomicrobiae bacterium]